MQIFVSMAAIGLYLISFFVLFKQLKLRTNNHHIFPKLFGIAIICHIVSLHFTVFPQQVLHLGFFKVSSLIFCVIAIISIIANYRRLEIENLIILLLPFAALSVACAQWVTSIDKTISETHLIIHVVLSIIAYSLMTLAALQALLLGIQETQLRQHQFTGVFRYFPPLQTMETLLFDLITAGTALLTLAILSGFFFLDDMFAQHLVHKTVLSIVAWCLFTVLLFGHHQKGWRGTVAVKWTLLGFAALMLAYFGSKFVLEIILQRV